MSVDLEQPSAASPSAGDAAGAAAPESSRRLRIPRLWVRDAEEEKARAERPVTPASRYLRAVLTGMALLLLGFLLLLVVGSPLQAQRDQRVLFDDLRQQLAEGVAPVGPTTSEGALVENGEPVAILSIPALGEDLVVVEGTTSTDTMAGPGHRRDTVLPGQAGVSIVMGRQTAYGGFFGRITTLQKGDEIRTTTGQGFATYVVTGVRRAGDPQPQPLQQGQARLVLVTATGTPYFPEGTVRVDAELVSTSADGTTVDKAPFAAAPRLVSPALLPADEKPLAGQTSQAFLLVLWAQLFLLAVVFITWARVRWGRWQAWIVGVPLVLATGWVVADGVAALLPNLL